MYGNGYIGSNFGSDVPIRMPKNFDILRMKTYLPAEVVEMVTTYSHSLLLMEGNLLYSWGDNSDGQLGVGDTLDRLEPTEITNRFGLNPAETFAKLATGDGHSVVLTSDYRVFAWGQNSYGQLGNNGSVDELLPVDITSNIPLGVGDFVVDIFTGAENTFLITNDGKLYAFGRNLYGCLGDGTEITQRLPIDVTTTFGIELTDAPAFIVASRSFTFLVTVENRVYAVGGNASGQLGDGTIITQYTPVEITASFPFDLSAINIIDFEVGPDYAGVLNSNNDVYMWGRGDQGQLGTGGTSSLLPLLTTHQYALAVGELIVDLGIGEGHTIVLTSLGNMFSNGFGTNYALGTTFTSNVSYPFDVTLNMDIGTDTIDYIVLGYQTTFLISQENNLYGFGRNLDGELGVGDTTARKLPTKLTKDKNDLNEIRFIYMQEEQYIDNAYVYVELYFEYDIWDALNSVVISSVTYTKASMEEDAGKISVLIPNTYVISESISFNLEFVVFNTGAVGPVGPVNVSATMYEDTEDPLFDLIEDQIIVAGTPDIDWTTYVLNVTDNSPGVITLSEVDGVNYSTNGSYSVEVTATDESLNFYSQSFSVQVIDTVPPVVTYTGETTFEVGGSSYDFLAFATSIDAIDGDLTDFIELSGTYDLDVVGLYSLTFSSTDSSMNTTELIVDIEVVDTTAPTFDLIDDQVYFIESPFPVDWESLVVNIVENSLDGVTIFIIDSVDYLTPGNYSVDVRVEDMHGNFTDQTFDVLVADATPPVLQVFGDIYIVLGETPNYAIYMDAFDYIDGDVNHLIVLDDYMVQTDVVGSYNVDIYAYDESLNVSMGNITVYVSDVMPPTFSMMDHLVFELGSADSYDWLTLVMNLMDDSGIQPILSIEFDDVDFSMSVHELFMRGRHNTYNSMAAGIAGNVLKIRNDVIREALMDFQGVEHRLETVTKVHGINFINDSKATNVNSSWYALESVNGSTVWIVGGVDKGNDYSELFNLVENKVKAIVCLGKDNARVIQAFSGKVESIVESQNMEEAVKAAYYLARDGETVLLSPACASFDLFESFEDRGRQFKTAVRGL